MRPMTVLFRRAGFFTILTFWATITILSAAEKIPGTLTVHDSLTSPNQPATIEATLIGDVHRFREGIAQDQDSVFVRPFRPDVLRHAETEIVRVPDPGRDGLVGDPVRTTVEVVFGFEGRHRLVAIGQARSNQIRIGLECGVPLEDPDGRLGHEYAQHHTHDRRKESQVDAFSGRDLGFARRVHRVARLEGAV